MLKFLVGLVVGVFLGVLVIAPNPQWSEQVQDLWVDARAWAAAFVGAAENVAEDVAEEAGEAAEEVKEGANDLAREAEEATR